MAKVKAQLIYCSDTSIKLGVVGSLKTPSPESPSFSFESSRLNIYEPMAENYGEEFIYEFSETVFEIETVDIFGEKTICKFLLI